MKPLAKSKGNPLKLGVTGGVGSGKSVVCDFLAGKGITLISADDLARRAVLPGTEAYKNIVNHFGTGVLNEDGGLDRKKMRAIITHDREAKKKLESIVHPEVFRLMEIEFKAADSRHESVVAVEVPLLFELGLKPFFDLTLTVSAERDIRIKRMMHRDQVSESDAEALLGIQMPEDVKIKQSDFVVDNNGDMEKLHELTEGFYQMLMTRIRS